MLKEKVKSSVSKLTEKIVKFKATCSVVIPTALKFLSTQVLQNPFFLEAPENSKKISNIRKTFLPSIAPIQIN